MLQKSLQKTPPNLTAAYPSILHSVTMMPGFIGSEMLLYSLLYSPFVAIRHLQAAATPEESAYCRRPHQARGNRANSSARAARVPDVYKRPPSPSLYTSALLLTAITRTTSPTYLPYRLCNSHTDDGVLAHAAEEQWLPLPFPLHRSFTGPRTGAGLMYTLLV
jgi:hypothetical protein